MKRLHVHVSVDNLEDSIKFYSTMFGVEPVKKKDDYAKWLLDDPRVNFAISARSPKVGLDHFGIQVDEDSELEEVRSRLKEAELKTLDEGKTTCCYADADKTWVIDPAGVPWETYRVMADAEVFGTDRKTESASQDGACCAPNVEKVKTSLKDAVNQKKSGACCG